MDVVGAGGLRATETSSLVRGRPPSAVGAAAATPAADTVQGPSGFRDTPGGGGHPGEGAETPKDPAGDRREGPKGGSPVGRSVTRRSRKVPEPEQTAFSEIL